MTQPRPLPNTLQDTSVRDFGLALAAARQKKGNSLRDIARKLGFGKETLRELEEGLLCPDAATFARLSAIFPAIDHHGPKLNEARQRAARAAADVPKAPPSVSLQPLGALTPARPRFGSAPPRLEKEPLRTPLAEKLAKVVVEPKRAPPPPPPPVAAPPVDVAPFGTWLKRAREASGMSQRELSVKMGVDNSTVTSWETHRFPVPETRLPELVKIFPSLENAPRPSPRDSAHYKPAPDRSRAAARGQKKRATREDDRRRHNIGGFQRLHRTVTLEALRAGETRLSFPAALIAERTAAKLNTAELAELLDVNRGSITFWEKGEFLPRQDRYDQLLALFPKLRKASPPHPDDAVTWVAPGKFDTETPPTPPSNGVAAAGKDLSVSLAPAASSASLPTMLGPTTPAPAPAPKAPAPMPPSASSPSSFANALSFLTKMQAVKKSKDLALFVGMLQTMRDEEVKAADVLTLLETL